MELFQQNNIAVVGASFNSVEQNAAFAAKNAYNFPILCDTDRTLGLAYGACTDPKARYAKRVSYLIDESGAIQFCYLSVNPRDHAAQVLADVLDAT